MGIGFKDIIRNDNTAVFLNFEEFGDMHTVGGRKMNIIIDENEMIEREKRRTAQGDLMSYRQGMYKETVLFYVLAQEYGPLPAIGRRIDLDGKHYLVTDAIDEDGIYSISLEAQRA